MSNDHVVIPEGANAAPVEPAPMDESCFAERRRYLRVKPDVLSAMLVVNGNRYVVAVRDISTGGARVANAPHDMMKGDHVQLIARLDEEVVDVQCRVARVEEDPLCPTVGVEFIDIDSNNTDKLLSFVCRLGMDVVGRT